MTTGGPGGPDIGTRRISGTDLPLLSVDLYLFPRFGVVPNHAHKSFVPYDNVFTTPIHLPAENASDRKTTSTIAADSRIAHHESIFVHAGVTEIGEGYIILDRDLSGREAPQQDIDHLSELLEQTGISSESSRRCVPWDYLVYALGCTLPPPLVSPSRTKVDGVKNLQAQQALIAKSESILIAGGGALGIQYATDIADLYNNPENLLHLPAGSPRPTPKKITLIHSRDRFMPLYDEAVDVEIKRRMKELGIKVILGERLALPSESELQEHELSGGSRSIKTSKGQEIEYDLLLRCTGQRANSDLLRSFLPASTNEGGFVNVLPTLQVALPPHDDSRINIFACGDVADAGVIKAGHTGWNQAGVVAENILHLLDHPFADRSPISKGGKGPDAVGVKRDALLEYKRSPPQIKVTLGLKHSVSELLPSMDATDTVVKTSDEGQVDGHWAVIWNSFGMDSSDPHK